MAVVPVLPVEVGKFPSLRSVERQRCDDQRHCDQHGAKGDGSPSSGKDPGVTHGVFHPLIGPDGSNQCGKEPDDVLVEWQAGLPGGLGGHYQHGPVPQVQRIGELPDPTKRSEAQERLGRPTGRRGAAGDHQPGSDDRNGDERAGVGGVAPKATAEKAIAASPIQSRSHPPASEPPQPLVPTATSAPSASSQARVKGEK